MIFTIVSIGKSQDKKAKVGIKKVVIDAGHGGKDPGCKGANKSHEKNVTLSVALKLGNLIKQNFPDIQIIYTRSTDEFIELEERAQIANKNNADLFISIHCNANPSSTPFGVETYVMGLHKTEANLEVAERENASILMEDNYQTHYQGFDPNSPESYIAISLMQNAYLDHSLHFASIIQSKAVNDAQRTDRGVKQAGFWVLYRTTMPSVLVEIGFLSNPEEEKYLISVNGQDKIVNAINNAFKEYKVYIEKTSTKTDNSPKDNKTNPKDKNTPTQKETATKTEKPAENKIVTIEDQNKKTVANTPVNQINSNNDTVNAKKATAETKNQNKTVTIADTSNKSKPVVNYGEVVKKSNNTTNDSAIVKTTKNTINTTNKTETVANTAIANNQVLYKVQIATSVKQLNTPELKKLNAKEYFDNNLFKYTVGEETELKKAVELQKQLQEKGYKDAFVVAFLNEKRISPAEAVKLLRKN